VDDTIHISAAGFSAALMELCTEVDGSVVAVIKKACFDLYAAIVKRTPVDTGRAKASWGIGVEHSDAVLPPGEYGDNGIVQMVGDATDGIFSFNVNDDQIVIYNNLDYISDLEDGASDQATTGMVAISLAEFEAHFRAALATQSVLT
jgi:hypothetical protein